MCGSLSYNTWKNYTRKCDIKVFIPVKSLYGVIELLYSSIMSFIGSTRKILSAIWINVKWIWASKNLTWTISECSNLCNIIHVTSNCMLIYWCYGAATVIWTPLVWYLSWKSKDVNYVPTSTKILSKSHQQNLSIFQILIEAYPIYSSLIL